LFVTLQPVQLVGVSVNVIWVTSQWPCGEYVYHVTVALWWICIPTWDVCNTTIRGQTGHKAL